MLSFDSPLVFVQLASDRYGDAPAISTPWAIRGASSWSLNIEDSIKEFRSSSMTPIHIARSERKISGSFEAPIPAALLAEMVTGLADGAERGTVMLKTPELAQTAEADTGDLAKITVTIPTGGTYSSDCGLSILSASGIVSPMYRTNANPTGYQYTVAVSGTTVTYKFEDSLIGRDFIGAVMYTKNGTGIQFSLDGGESGETPVFKIRAAKSFKSISQAVEMDYCVFSKPLTQDAKRGDFSMLKPEFECFAPLGKPAGTAYYSNMTM